MFFNEQEKKELIEFVKKVIQAKLNGKEFIPEESFKEKYSKKSGVFVTLKINNQLRGCIGYIHAIYPLWKALMLTALNAAFNDPRFLPITKEEFSKIKIEISILTEPKLIEVNKPEEYLNKIEIGKDGLIIYTGYTSGLLLPQVFVEYNCNVKQALEMTCLKAGLNKDAWQDLTNKIYKFQAVIIQEDR